MSGTLNRISNLVKLNGVAEIERDDMGVACAEAKDLGYRRAIVGVEQAVREVSGSKFVYYRGSKYARDGNGGLFMFADKQGGHAYRAEKGAAK